MWLEKLFSLKFAAMLIAILFMMIGLGGIGLGLVSVYHAFLVLIGRESGRVGVHLIESIDKLLFSLVIMILSAGIYKLFTGNKATYSNSLVLKGINSFKELKILLWETLLLTLTVWSSLGFLTQTENFRLEQLILPGSILLLAIALYIVKGKNKEDAPD
jgi:hypothetical protein